MRTACALQVLWMASLPSALFGLGLANCFLFKRYGAPVVYCLALSALCLGFGLLVLAPFSPAVLTGLPNLNPNPNPNLNPSPSPNPSPNPNLNPSATPTPTPTPDPNPNPDLAPLTLSRRSPASYSSAALRPSASQPS